MKYNYHMRLLFPILFILLLSPGFLYAGDSPYGDKSTYGEKHSVSSQSEAMELLTEFYKDKEGKISNLTEQEFFYEAELILKDGSIVDRIIIDKRTGRIRSIH